MNEIKWVDKNASYMNVLVEVIVNAAVQYQFFEHSLCFFKTNFDISCFVCTLCCFPSILVCTS